MVVLSVAGEETGVSWGEVASGFCPAVHPVAVEEKLANCGTVVVRPVSDARCGVVWKDCSGGGEDSSSRPRNLGAEVNCATFSSLSTSRMKCSASRPAYATLFFSYTSRPS